jgi:hypothetical protein
VRDSGVDRQHHAINQRSSIINVTMQLEFHHHEHEKLTAKCRIGEL